MTNKTKIELSELFDAYFNCRRNKRNTANALAFEVDYENNLIQLCEEINNGTYQPGRSIAFIVDKPIKREIFAADFRDRVVHHLIINKMNPLFEKQFIYDSSSCRVGKGTHFGIQHTDHFIRQCSKNYTQDCCVLKLDIQGFFMNINKNINSIHDLSCKILNKIYLLRDNRRPQETESINDSVEPYDILAQLHEISSNLFNEINILGEIYNNLSELF